MLADRPAAGCRRARGRHGTGAALGDPRFYLTDDSAAQFLPSWYHLGELLRSGQFPLLDPTLWAGGNIAAEALFGIWNPVLLATMVLVSPMPNLVVASVWSRPPSS